MIKFYLLRLEYQEADNRQNYLDTVVVERFRDDVRTQWNSTHDEGSQLQ